MKLHQDLVLLEVAVIIAVCSPLVNCNGDVTCGKDYCVQGSDKLCYDGGLEELPERVGNNAVAVLCTTNASLTTNITFSHLQNVSITSFLSNTTITCEAENTGLLFRDCYNIAISYLTIKGCGFHHSDETNHYKSSLYVLDCVNVILSSVAITNSKGNGLIMTGTSGRVNISNCKFERNRLIADNVTEASVMGGGGVFLDVVRMDNGCGGNKSCNTYIFDKCKFLNNTASRNNSHNHTEQGQRLERGGGLNIAIRETASHNLIKIVGGLFQENSAKWAGGLYVVYHKTPRNNSVEIIDTKFIQNQCTTDKGGGGSSIGYAFFHDNPPYNNRISFTGCWFIGNRARFAGGVAIYSSRSAHIITHNMFLFTNCTWKNNEGQYGSAVTVLPQIWDGMKNGFLPTTIFTKCIFASNTMKEVSHSKGMYTFSQNGKGALLVSRFTVEFQGITNFTGSTSSAIYVTSGFLKFARGSTATFFNNSGADGGAISLHGFSAMYLNDNSTITFKNNSATKNGGAIYFYSFNKQDYTYSHSCFIQYEGEEEDMERRNLTLTFRDNLASTQINDTLKPGNSIFATNLMPCKARCNLFSDTENHCNRNDMNTTTNDRHPFSCVATFELGNGTNEIATSGQEFCMQPDHDDPNPLKVIPGKEFQVPVTLYDDLSQNAKAVYHVSVENPNTDSDPPTSQITIDKQYVFTQRTKVKLYGEPRDRGQVKIATLGTREIAVTFDVELQQCPPGYVMNGTKPARRCVCSAYTTNTSYKIYMGVRECDDTSFQAYISRGFWIGYIFTNKGSENESEYSLFSAYCPNSFCFHNHLHENHNKYKLIDKASKQDLDRRVCGLNRTGILCGKCRTNYSVYYHTHGYHCFKNYLCNWGPVFYILSEIIPVSILFIVVTIFNVPFTSGAVNGALFYIQVINTMQTNHFISVKQNEYQRVYTRLYHLIYRPFNLNFFSIQELSFCLLKGATALDMIAFKYVTIVYSLLLVVVTVAVIRLCNYQRLHCNRRRRKGRGRRAINVQSSIIHGLSAFFVMTYSLCTRVSLMLLTPGTVRPISTNNYTRSIHRAVFYNGELEFLKREHLKYAIPAMFFTVVYILIPPILLIVYPLCYRVFGLLRIGETRCVQITCKIIPLERLKPLFDSFQGSFKDQYRFFSGLYFLYRLVALSGFAFTTSITRFYTILEVLLILMLTFHAIAQPYKKRWHNILDTLLFGNLAVINRLTMHNYKRFSVRFDYQTEIETLALIQDILRFLPFVYLLFYAVTQTVLKVKQYCHERRTMDDENEDDDWFLMSDITDNTSQ